MAEHGDFLWNELMTKDLDGSKAFYAAVLGWSYDDMDVGTGPYTVIAGEENGRGGMMHMQGAQFDGVPSHWMAYVMVADVDDVVAKVAAAGGNVLQPPFEVPTVGRIALIADPSGAALGVMTPMMRAS